MQEGRHMRLATSGEGALFVPRTRTTLNQGSFAVHGPTTWDRLPAPCTPFTGADAAYVQTQTEDASVPALIAGAAWRAHGPALLRLFQRYRRRLYIIRLNST